MSRVVVDQILKFELSLGCDIGHRLRGKEVADEDPEVPSAQRVLVLLNEAVVDVGDVGQLGEGLRAGEGHRERLETQAEEWRADGGSSGRGRGWRGRGRWCR